MIQPRVIGFSIIMFFIAGISVYSKLTKAEDMGQPLYVPIVKVVDGDTIHVKLPLPIPLDDVYLRIRGIDTPETTWRAKCTNEQHLGFLAKKEVEVISSNAPYAIITNYDYDKYGGRIVGDVSINGVNLSEHLINKQLAHPYSGKGLKETWCEVNE